MARWVNLDDCIEISTGEMNFYPVELLGDIYEDVALVVHAHWIIEPWETNWRHSCSNPKCNHYEFHAYEDYRGSNYCPVCGAKMDEEV